MFCRMISKNEVHTERKTLKQNNMSERIYLHLRRGDKIAHIPLHYNADIDAFELMSEDNSTMLSVISSAVEAEFNVGDIRKRCRKGNLPIARDAFAKIASTYQFTIADIAEYLELNKRTIYTLIVQADMNLLHNIKFKHAYDRICRKMAADKLTDQITDQISGSLWK